MWAKIKAIALKVLGAVLAIAAAVAAAFFGYKFLRVQLAKVIEKRFWRKVPGDNTQIEIWGPSGEYKTVKLPMDGEGKQVTIDQVVAAGFSAKGVVSVEIEHMPVDRRPLTGW